jgi:hypothetical protein
MKTFKFFLLLLIAFSTLSSKGQTVKRIFADAEKQTSFMLDQVPLAKAEWLKDTKNAKKPNVVSPRSLSPEGKLNLVASKDWTSGFFPGVLWLLYDFTGNKKWETQAREFTANIENEKMNAGTHDMGFKIYNSFGQGYRITNDPSYKEVIIQGAKTLSKRFNPIVGCIRSWDHSRDKWGFPVIIDNMLNLELLFAVTRMTGDSSFYKIAVSHANTTLKNHFRSDFSSYHVVDYDTITGKVEKKNTHQGFSHESSWARGQAWGLYGYTMCYRETKDPKYLLQAENIASFLLNHPNLPKDLVPYWDFDAPNIPNEPRDASAGAVICSALFELSTFSKNGIDYRKKANQILANLTNDYRSAIGANKGFLLLHSTGTKPTNIEVDVPIIYADYYYLEALIRSQKLRK